MKKFSLSTILIAMVLMSYAMAFTPHVRADGTVVSVLPATVEISAVDQTQTVDINISAVTNLFGWEAKIFYLKTIVNVTVAVRPTGHFMEPLDPANSIIAKWVYTYNFNDTHGLVWLGFAILSPETARSGSGILARITFKGIAVGSTPVVISYPGFAYPAKLANDVAEPIPCTATEGTINVIPEFILLLPVLAITSLAAVSLAKLRRRKQLL